MVPASDIEARPGLHPQVMGGAIVKRQRRSPRTPAHTLYQRARTIPGHVATPD